MATPTIPNGEEYFFPIIYEGNGAGQRVGKFVPFTNSGTIAKSCVFDDGANDYLSRTSGTATSTKTFTVSLWCKRANLSTQTMISLANLTGTSKCPVINWGSGNTIQLATSGGSALNKITNRTFEDTSKFYHILVRYDLTQDAADDRVRLYVDGDQITSFGTNTNTLQKTDDFVLNSQTQHIGRTVSSGSPTQYLDGYLAEINYIDGQSLGPSSFGLTDTSTGRWIPKTVSPFPTTTTDIAVTVVDSGGNKYALDGVTQDTVTLIEGATYKFDQSDSSNSGHPLRFSTTSDGTHGGGSEYTTGVTTVGTPGSSGAYTQITVATGAPTLYYYCTNHSGMGGTANTQEQYGTNGFRLEFGTSSAMGDDTSGKENDFSPTNIDATNQTTDSPTQNHATLSPHSAYKSSNFTLSEGNLKATSTSTSGTHSGQGGMRIPSGGKYYWECEIDAGKDGMGIGVIPTDTPTTSANPSTATLYLSNGSMRTDGSNAISYGSGVDNGNIMGFALDLSNPSAGKLYVSVNGVYENSGNPVTGANPAPSNQLTGDLRVIYQDGSNGFEPVYIYNFGQKSFNTAPPTGFVALQQDNLPETAKGVSGLVWMKNRDANDNHQLYDSSRGAQIALTPNTTGAESTVVDGLQKFLAGGQQIEDNNLINTSGESFVSWNWVANGGTTESISAAGEFDIASTVQKNLTAGFSIVQYTGNGNSTDGQGVGHGLGAEPKWIIIKELTGDSWNCWHGAFGNEKILLNDPGKKFSSTAFGNYTPSSTIFKVRGNNTNASSTNYVAYCWKEIAGYSKFGSYGGGGSVTPFIYTGFQPALIIIKCTSDNSTDWVMYDNKRDPINVNATQSTTLYPNLPDDDASAGGIHFFSNGFQPKSTNGFNNGTSRSYIYIAFSKNDFLGDGTSPMTAR